MGRGEIKIAKRHKETLAGDGYVHLLDCENDFKDVYVC